MSSKTTKNCVFTHHDLDGVVSYLVLSWFYPNLKFECFTIRNVFDFRKEYLNWCLKNSPKDYEHIFILDLDVSGCEDLLDQPNFFIFDHHDTHLKAVYNNAKAFVKKYSSACKLMYKILSMKFPDKKLTEAQKLLIGFTDDFDSYTLKYPVSKQLNTLFWNYTPNNFQTFFDNFKNGFHGFNIQQQSIIKLYETELKAYYKNIKEVYYGEYTWNNKKYSACAIFASKHINDLADLLFESQKCDIIFMYNKKSNKIYVRRNRTNNGSDLHIGKICEQWGGGGHEGAGGGPAHPEFLEFSKTLKCKAL